MNKLLRVIFIVVCFSFMKMSHATIILVENTSDSDPGSLRSAISSASLSDNDTILINVKGEIELESTLIIDGFTSLTIIGPYPKHNSITASVTCSGRFLWIKNSANITIRGLGFIGGNSNTRHVDIDTSNAILFESCLFENSILSFGNGGSIKASKGIALFKGCSFINNTAMTGGAIRTRLESALTFENCTFDDNYSYNNAGAISVYGNSSVNLYYSTFINNNALGSGQAVRSSATCTVRVENLAIGENGMGLQFDLNGIVVNTGAIIMDLNEFDDLPISPVSPSDYSLIDLDLGLRTTILENGFGLKHWPIVSATSPLINPRSSTGLTPAFDCRFAPRNLKGNSMSLTYPDAGACEYTHLRVTNSSGEKSSLNSFLWTLEPAQQKDAVHYVEFDIPVPVDIEFTSQGSIDKTYIIDGYSQFGSAIPGPVKTDEFELIPPKIKINFVSDGVNDGILFNAGSHDSRLQGVSVQGFDHHGIEVNVENMLIFGCEIGIDDLGEKNGNGRMGLEISNDNNRIGGWEHWMRNTISGNGFGTGPQKSNLAISSGSYNIIQGNIIGGHPNGNESIVGDDKTKYGIFIEDGYTKIGGRLPNTRNIIVNNQFGIYCERFADHTLIRGNIIGVGNELTAISNEETGIFLRGADYCVIGGVLPANRNIIAHNKTGISFKQFGGPAIFNTILGNLIYSNTQQGIDFYNDGTVYPNDNLADPSKHNEGLDHPVLIESSNCDGADTKTTYSLSVPSGENYRVEFFSTTLPDATNGEGEEFRGSYVVAVTSTPQTFTFDHLEYIPSGYMTATVTRILSGSTSEFGTNVIISEPIDGDSEISYLNICHGADAVPEPFDFGGTFRFAEPIPLDVLIDPDYGIVVGGLEDSIYTVIYDFSLICLNEDTTSFHITSVDESFLMDDFCFGDTGFAISTPLLDTFFLAPDPGDGVLIDEYSGELTNGLGDSIYTIRRIAYFEGCSDTMDVDVFVIDPNAEFIFDDICPGEVSLAPDAENVGVFSFGVDPIYGETIDSGTGIITSPYEGGSYTVLHVVTIGACVDSVTHIVGVHILPEEFSIDTFCWQNDSPLPETADDVGTFVFVAPGPDDGAVINLVNGIISNATENTIYEVVHIYSTEFCTQTDTVSVLAIGVDESFVFDDFCPATYSPAPVHETDGGEYIFDPEPLDGAVIDEDSGIIFNSTDGTTYSVRYTVSSDLLECYESSIQTVTNIGVDEGFLFPDFCAEFSGIPSDIATGDGVFSYAPDPLDDSNINAVTGIITGAVPSTVYPIAYSVGVCGEIDTNYVLAKSTTIADFILEDHCSNILVEAEGSDESGGEFVFNPVPLDDALIDEETGVITNSNGGNYTVQYVTLETDEVCGDTVLSDITLFPVPEITSLASDQDKYCPNDVLYTIDATTIASNVYWYKSNTEGDPIDTTFNYLPNSLNIGDNLFYAQAINAQGCLSDFESYSFYLSDTTNMFAIQDFEICLGSAANIEAFGGSTYEWSTDVPLTDYTLSNFSAFSLKEEVYIVTIKNSDDCVVIDTVNVLFLDKSECGTKLYNAFSPNNDGKNDFWYIDNLINFLPNTVYIYNRWGDEIRAINDYDNITAYWDGTDGRGNELPPNTYFYVVITDDPNQNQGGWVQLVR